MKPFDNEVRSTYRRLTWKDFGKPMPLRGSTQAYIYSGLELDVPKIEVRQDAGGGWIATAAGLRLFAYVDKLESAVRIGGKTDYALAHEQLHFDITEVHTRRLRAELAGVNERAENVAKAQIALQKSITETYRETLRELESTQERYDRETRHGKTKKVQSAWSKKVARWLSATEGYLCRE